MESSERSHLATYPTSIKGVLLVDGGVLLVQNSRKEWELPGGRPDAGEDHNHTLIREFSEELSLNIRPGAHIDSYLFEVIPGRAVFIVTYGCTLDGEFHPSISNEHNDYCLWPVECLAELNLPVGYRRSIETWKERTDSFRSTALHSRPIFLLFSACLIGACIIHILDIWRHGWFDALAAVLLLFAPRAGLMLALIIIASDVALNMFARFYLGLSLRSYFLVCQCAFLFAVVAVMFYARRAAAALRAIR